MKPSLISPRIPLLHFRGFPVQALALLLAAQGLAFVSQVAAQQQPTIQITSPSPGITLVTGTPITLAATVNDPDNQLARVLFSLNGQPFAQTSSRGPFTLNATAPPVPGRYQVTITAVDVQGRQTSSSGFANVVAPDPANPVSSSSLVTRDGDLSSALTVFLKVGGTATSGVDYLSPP